MNIQEATALYEQWMGQQIDVVESDIAYKHQKMALAPFPFMRATYYRWAKTWQSACPELASAATVLSVGDLHLENFGTWRDAEGRLIWGVNDFDEAYPMPWPADLIRLATSALLVIDAEHLGITHSQACDSLLSGYVESIKNGGRPFVLADEHGWLRVLALQALREERFWNKLNALVPGKERVPEAAATVLAQRLPEPGIEHRIVHRTAGLGSLGRQRWVALADWRGGKIAREAKAVLPSACYWAAGGASKPDFYYLPITRAAVRVPDPVLAVLDSWIVRRLAPDCCRIELADLPESRDEYRLLYSMGYETANIHLGSPGAQGTILHDLEKLPGTWLKDGAERMRKLVMSDWKDWKKSQTGT
jgi:hypothetical protein